MIVPISSYFSEADARIRTGDPFITSEVLYQLSYVGGRLRSLARGLGIPEGGELHARHGLTGHMIPARLRDLEQHVEGEVTFLVATTFLSRLLGLSFLDDAPRDCVLVLPRCASVHTFGMRFPLDLTFLDAQGRELQAAVGVPPRRFVRHRGAATVLERRSRETD